MSISKPQNSHDGIRISAFLASPWLMLIIFRKWEQTKERSILVRKKSVPNDWLARFSLLSCVKKTYSRKLAKGVLRFWCSPVLSTGCNALLLVRQRNKKYLKHKRRNYRATILVDSNNIRVYTLYKTCTKMYCH